MKVRYFEDTDTMLIELRDAPVAETRDLDDNTILDLDAKGNICSITIEHASVRAVSVWAGPIEGFGGKRYFVGAPRRRLISGRTSSVMAPEAM
jgi:uncharacterized protein YuzE